MSLVFHPSRPVLVPFTAMGLLWGSYAAVMPQIKTQLDVTEAQLGLLLSFSPLAAVTAMLLAPRIGAALGRYALPLVIMAMGLAFCVPAQASVQWMFVFGIMCCGASTGLLDVLMNARTAQIEQEQSVPLMNLCHAGYSFGYGGGAIMAGVLRGYGGSAGQIMLLMGLMVVALAFVAIEHDGTINGLRAQGNKLANRLGWVPMIAGGVVLIAFLTENATESWSALHIEQSLGGSPEEGALGPALLAFTMGVGRLMGQRVLRFISAYRLVVVASVVAAIGAMIAAQAITPLMAHAGFMVMGIGVSVIVPTMLSLVGALAKPEQRARAVARATVFGYCGYFVGPPGLGLVAGQLGLRAAFVVVALMLLLVVGLIPLLQRAAPKA